MDSVSFPSVPQPATAQVDELPETRTSLQVHLRTERAPRDADLVQASLQGNSQAWNELVERYQRLVYSIPRQHGLSPAVAEDVMRTVFLMVFRRLATLRDQTRLSAWLIRVTQRATLNYLKQGHLEEALLEEIAEREASDEHPLERPETQDLLRQARSLLDRQTRGMEGDCPAEATPSDSEPVKQEESPGGGRNPTRARAFKKLQAVLQEMELAVR